MWSMSSIGLWNKSYVSRVNTLRKFSWIIKLLDQVNYIISNPWPSHFIETYIQTIWAWTCIWSHIFNNVPNFLFVWNRGCIFILYWWCFLTIVLLWYLKSSALRREQFVEVIVKHRSYLILSCDRRTIFLCQISYSVFGCSPYNCPDLDHPLDGFSFVAMPYAHANLRSHCVCSFWGSEQRPAERANRSGSLQRWIENVPWKS